MSDKQPTPIVDKNGKATTVHKKIDNSAPNLRLGSVRPFIVTRTPEEVAAKQFAFLSDLSHDYRSLVPGVTSFEIGTKYGEEAYVVRAIDADGNSITQSSEFATFDVLEGINRSLRNIDFTAGQKAGYITKSAPNKNGALFTLDLDKSDAAVRTNAINTVLRDTYGNSPELLVKDVEKYLDADYEGKREYKKFDSVRNSIWNFYAGGDTASHAAIELFTKLGLEDEINPKL